MSKSELRCSRQGAECAGLDAPQGLFVERPRSDVFRRDPDHPAAYVFNRHVKLTRWQPRGIPPHGFDRHARIGLRHAALNASNEASLNAPFERVGDTIPAAWSNSTPCRRATGRRCI